MKKCCVFGAGDYANVDISKEHLNDAFVVAADAGLLALRKLGINANLAVGDFDSLGFVPDDIKAVKHPAEKDDTDMMLALREGIKRGCDTFYIYGALGGRIDHSYANFQLLSYLAKNGIKAYLIGSGFSATSVKNASLRFSDRFSGYVSVFCAGDKALGVNISGLKYELKDAVLDCFTPLGVSNEFCRRASEISVSDGSLLVMFENAPGGILPEIVL